MSELNHEVALEQAKKLLEEEARLRAEACIKEVRDILQKYGCKLDAVISLTSK